MHGHDGWCTCCIHTCAYIHVHACMDIHTCAYMYIHVHARINNAPCRQLCLTAGSLNLIYHSISVRLVQLLGSLAGLFSFRVTLKSKIKKSYRASPCVTLYSIIFYNNEPACSGVPRVLDLSFNALSGPLPLWASRSLPSLLATCDCNVVVELRGPQMAITCPSATSLLGLSRAERQALLQLPGVQCVDVRTGRKVRVWYLIQLDLLRNQSSMILHIRSSYIHA
jgi:hypothetical protein